MEKILLFGVLRRRRKNELRSCDPTGPAGLADFQHRDGKAQIHISGCFSLPSSLPDQEKVRVYARIVREDDGFTVIDWTPAQMTDHTFSLTLADVPLGGLYRLETCMPREGNGWSFEWAVRGDIRHHLGVGDLFVIAGKAMQKVLDGNLPMILHSWAYI